MRRLQGTLGKPRLCEPDSCVSQAGAFASLHLGVTVTWRPQCVPWGPGGEGRLGCHCGVMMPGQLPSWVAR